MDGDSLRRRPGVLFRDLFGLESRPRVEDVLMAAMTREAARYRHILEALIHPLFWKDRELRYLGCNSAFARLVGLSRPEQVVGRRDSELSWGGTEAQRFRQSDLEILASEAPLPDVDEFLLGASGKPRWVHTSKVPLRDENGAVIGVLGMFVERTAQRQARLEQLEVARAEGDAATGLMREQASEREAMERALAASQQRLRAAVRGANMIIWALDAQGRFTFLDGGGLEVSGFAPEQLLGQSLFDVFRGAPAAVAQARQVLASGEPSTEVVPFASGHFETRYTPVFDEVGSLAGAIGLSTDVTERVRASAQMEAELERTRAQLLQVERLATLGTLAAGVGHELRNISTVLHSLRSALTDWAREGVAPEPEVIEGLGWACEHVTLHGRQLMNLGQPGQTEVARVDLRELVSGTLAMLRTAGVTRHVKLSLSMPDAPVWVEASRTRVEQVLINLVRNAADAVEGVKDRPAEVRVHVSEEPRTAMACCRVEDTGVGMPEHVLASIFEPWFTTKPPGRGTGLGLPVVRNILEECGGTLSVESQPGQGSAFTFRLPSQLPPGG